MDERIDDIRAVMDAAGSQRAVLVGVSEGGAMCQLYAATYPERVSALILMGTYSNARESLATYRDVTADDAALLKIWGTGDSLSAFAPGLTGDPAFVEWWATFERLSASPSAVIRLRHMNAEIDVTPILPAIQAPTLVLHRGEDVRCDCAHARRIAATIPNARFVEYPGKDHFVWLEETGAVLSEIQRFIANTQEPIEPDRVLATVLFTDIVDSTRRASEMGDMQWRHVVEAHFSMARHQLRRFRGREVKSLGDGILATFDGPARAIRCARAIAASVKPLGIAVRAGLHTGEVELRDASDIAGIAVHVASRVSQLAEGGQVLVSGTVRDLVAGSGLGFADLGPRALKGIEQAVRIFEVTGEGGAGPAGQPVG